MAKNTHMHLAKDKADDEFYTRYDDVDAELRHYWQHFTGKVVHCPCDGADSAFYQYLHTHYNAIGLAGLTATQYNPNGQGMLHGTDGTDDWSRPLDDDGSFASYSAQRIMDRCDIVITNPPFSLLGRFLDQVIKAGKDFLIVVPTCAFDYSVVRHLIPTREVIIGTQNITIFVRPDGSTADIAASWMTTLDHGIVPPPIELTATYDPELHPTYDNFDAIDVKRIADIPKDYDGIMGVPYTFLGKWNPEQFEIVGTMRQLSKDFEIKSKQAWRRLCIRKAAYDVPYIDGARQFTSKLPIRRK